MMRFIVALSILCLIAFSCKKNKTEPSSPYIGTWEVRGYSGPNDVSFTFSYMPGNGSLIKYTMDTLYHYRNGQLYSQYDYHIAKDTCHKCYNIPRLMDRLYYRDEAEVTLNRQYSFQEIKNDTLLFYTHYLNSSYDEIYQLVRVADR